MNRKMQIEALEIIRPFIRSELEDLSGNWWNEYVLPCVSRRNQDTAWRLGDLYLDRMDFAEAQRVLWNNWDLIADRHNLDERYRGVLAHLHHARNADAHPDRVRGPEWDAYDQFALDLLLDGLRWTMDSAA